MPSRIGQLFHWQPHLFVNQICDHGLQLARRDAGAFYPEGHQTIANASNHTPEAALNVDAVNQRSFQCLVFQPLSIPILPPITRWQYPREGLYEDWLGFYLAALAAHIAAAPRPC